MAFLNCKRLKSLAYHKTWAFGPFFGPWHQFGGHMTDIDDLISDEEEYQRKEAPRQRIDSEPVATDVLVGRVEHFFSNINVAAIALTRRLAVGDTIEIKNEEQTVRLKVYSMQIDRKDVDVADEGDDIGIKIGEPVKVGSDVYLVR